MQVYIIRRLLQTILVIIIVTFVAFSLTYLIPGDPVRHVLGPDATQQDVNALRVQLGLDQPMMLNYGHWLLGVLHGEFGKSILTKENVSNLIAHQLPITLYLGIISMVFVVIFGVSAGVVSAVRRASVLDAVITTLANIGVAVPVFWLGILGIYIFALKLGLLPVYGFTSPFENFGLSLKQIIMPVICLSVGPLAGVARQTRSATLEVIHRDYIRTAWAKGLAERVIILRHALKNSLIPVVTLLGTQIRYVVGGSVFIETVFNINGIGRLTITGVTSKDFPVVEACVLIIAVVVALANLAVDISYVYLDPRIRYQ